MGELNAIGMSEIAEARKKRAEALNSLIAQPFNLSNKEQVTALKKYIDEFELHVNQMYLFQGMSKGFKIWVGSWFTSLILPIPQFVNYFLSAFLYFGAAGYLLKTFNTTNFYNNLEEMKTLYNWVLKGGNPNYDNASNGNNIEKLNHTEIQRMIKLLAPLCPVEFVLAWQPVTVQKEAAHGWSAIINLGQKTYGRLFSSAPEPSEKLKMLQTQVETGELNMNALEGWEQAMRYFATSVHFRTVLVSSAQTPFEYLKSMLPEVVTKNIEHLKMS